VPSRNAAWCEVCSGAGAGAAEMAFHIRPDESVTAGLRRVARKELASARDRLQNSKEPGEDAIHEARKSVKKVRAVADVVKTTTATDWRAPGNGCEP
jgi:hypothetical protein